MKTAQDKFTCPGLEPPLPHGPARGSWARIITSQATLLTATGVTPALPVLGLLDLDVPLGETIYRSSAALTGSRVLAITVFSALTPCPAS